MLRWQAGAVYFLGASSRRPVLRIFGLDLPKDFCIHSTHQSKERGFPGGGIGIPPFSSRTPLFFLSDAFLHSRTLPKVKKMRCVWLRGRRDRVVQAEYSCHHATSHDITRNHAKSREMTQRKYKAKSRRKKHKFRLLFYSGHFARFREIREMISRVIKGGHSIIAIALPEPLLCVLFRVGT